MVTSSRKKKIGFLAKRVTLKKFRKLFTDRPWDRLGTSRDEMTAPDPNTRCGWVTNDPLYIEYHDKEWGVPVYDDILLFEMLCLEGQQAGLSWLTILKKRNNYKKLFFNFVPSKVCDLSDEDVTRLISDESIIRHKGKIQSIINNAQCFLRMQESGECFSNFVWNFVDNKPIINKWQSNEQVPSETLESVALSKALKKRGFKFVGSKICYSFMQACGLVDDHIVSCVSYSDKKSK